MTVQVVLNVDEESDQLVSERVAERFKETGERSESQAKDQLVHFKTGNIASYSRSEDGEHNTDEDR